MDNDLPQNKPSIKINVGMYIIINIVIYVLLFIWGLFSLFLIIFTLGIPILIMLTLTSCYLVKLYNDIKKFKYRNSNIYSISIILFSINAMSFFLYLLLIFSIVS